MIGGTDVELPVGDGVPVADVVFRTIRRYWPDYVIENALDESPPFKPPAGLGIPAQPSPEFFIYRDEQAATDWGEHGATPENANLMVYVLMGDDTESVHGPRSITIVVGSPTGELRSFLKELRELFCELTFGMVPNTDEAKALAA